MKTVRCWSLLMRIGDLGDAGKMIFFFLTLTKKFWTREQQGLEE
jgi:hypothetical protein